MNALPVFLRALLLTALFLAQTASASNQATDQPAAPADRADRALYIESLLSDAVDIPTWGHLTHGELAVGFRYERGLSIWYPAEAGGAPVTLAAYASARDFQGRRVKVSDLLQRPMYASEGAPPLAGPYPLVVVPGGYLNPGMVAATAEYLASHGLLVVFFQVPSDVSNKKALSHALVMAGQIDLPQADKSRVALWGYQRGGALAMIMQDPFEAQAVISVEGSEGWRHEEYGYPALRRQLKKIKGQAPVLRFASSREKPRWYFSSPANTTLEWYSEYAGSFEPVDLGEVNHDQLSAFAIWAHLAPGFMKPSAGALTAHRTMAEAGLRFLKTHFEG
ncbi:MAG: hypothetical protein AAGA23_17200 [Pseudomonadota bacterium]